uniref:Uncharacterized protein n=1 Tax=Panagrolaimus davidi TaxID=227884 RepID=A0A914NYI3_9BILA
MADGSYAILKAIVIGDSGCGKTWLITSFLGGDINSKQNTIGIEFSSRSYDVDGKAVKVQFWDTAGQDKFRVVVNQFYRRANAIACVYDVTNYESFKNIQKWYDEAQQFIDNQYVVMLIGNKIDLSSKREVPTEEGEEFARQKGFFFMETSAKQNKNVEIAFQKLIEESCRQVRRSEAERRRKEVGNVVSDGYKTSEARTYGYGFNSGLARDYRPYGRIHSVNGNPYGEGIYHRDWRGPIRRYSYSGYRGTYLGGGIGRYGYGGYKYYINY